MKALMVGLGLEPWVAGWKAQTNSLSYGGTPFVDSFKSIFLFKIPTYLLKQY